MRHVGEVPRIAAADCGQVGGGSPLVVSGLAASWPPESLILDEVATRHGATEIPIYVSPVANFGLPENLGLPEDRQIMPLSAVTELFGQRRREIDGGTWYSRGITFDYLPGIEDVIPLPPLIADRRMKTRNLWLSPGGTTSVLHYDNLHNLLVIVSGEKTLKLFAPESEDSIYLYPANTAMPHVSRVDVDNPDLIRFPRFAEAPYLTVHLRAGDALYMPAYWFHHVKTPHPSMAVNFWWPPPIGDCGNRILEKLLASNYVYYEHDKLANVIDLTEVCGPLSTWLLAGGRATAALLAAAGELIRALRHAVAGGGAAPPVEVNRELTLLPAGAPRLGATAADLAPWLELAQRVRLRRLAPSEADATAMVAVVNRLLVAST